MISIKKNNILVALIKSLRPTQWIKNVALYAPLVFSGFFFFDPVDGPPYFHTVTIAFALFSVLTSSLYIINDIADVESDRKHPVKKKRPIAAGELPIPLALFSAIIGIFLVFFFSLSFTPFFRVLIILYVTLQLIYSFKVKHVPILDVMSIAAGFIIRVYAGAMIVDLHMSVWFLLTVISASLFLAVGKRQSEKTLMSKHPQLTRRTLSKYSERLLDLYTGMFANATWLTYALYTFQTSTSNAAPATERFPQIYVILPRTLQSQKLLMLTVPLVIFGVMRYLALIYEENIGESPDKVLLNDKTLLATVFSLVLLIMAIIYL
jgi:4-hydroxybenzoate polyprenyltransferase